jgi:hypothetical protein
LNYPNEPWRADLVFKQIGKDFTPALGFINRTNIRQYQGTVANLTRYRGTYLNQLEFGTDYLFVTDLNNRLESRENDIYVRAASRGRRRGHGTADQRLRESPGAGRSDEPFRIAGRVPVLPGKYEWSNFDAKIRTFNGRPLSLQAELICCSFYNGDSSTASLR